jgi:Acetyltransferase (isoleucine patch superfamily)
MGNFHRICQLARYGWLHAGQISEKEFAGKKRLSLFVDIILCYNKYDMWSNQYLREHFWGLGRERRSIVGRSYKEINKIHEEWVKDFYDNRKFIAKWSGFDIEKKAKKREDRNKAYALRYGAGKNIMVEHGVELSRQHHLPGIIKIGDDVLLAKDVFIDYSGEVVLSNNVKLSAGVKIESHRHEFIPGANEYHAIPTSVIIEDGAWIGQGTIISENCKRIGRYSQIGAGSVVRTPIPPYAIVIGNPAKIVGFVYTPDEVQQFEDKYFPNNPIDIEQYKYYYEKYFINKITEIKQFTKL